MSHSPFNGCFCQIIKNILSFFFSWRAKSLVLISLVFIIDNYMWSRSLYKNKDALLQLCSPYCILYCILYPFSSWMFGLNHLPTGKPRRGSEATFLLNWFPPVSRSFHPGAVVANIIRADHKPSVEMVDLSIKTGKKRQIVLRRILGPSTQKVEDVCIAHQ